MLSKTLFKSMQLVKVLIIRRMGRGRKEERQIKGMWRKEMREKRRRGRKRCIGKYAWWREKK